MTESTNIAYFCINLLMDFYYLHYTFLSCYQITNHMIFSSDLCLMLIVIPSSSIRKSLVLISFAGLGTFSLRLKMSILMIALAINMMELNDNAYLCIHLLNEFHYLLNTLFGCFQIQNQMIFLSELCRQIVSQNIQ